MRLEAVKKLGTIGVAHPQIIERLKSVASNNSPLMFALKRTTV